MNTFDKAKSIVKKLQDNGFEAVFCGGWVRDFILDLPSHDIDIATSATPDEVENLFDRTLPLGKAFGIVSVMIDNEEFQVATFRTDSKTSDGRRPDFVKFSSMKEDAFRRDFTINGMFFDPITNQIIDFVDGKIDIKDNVINFIGSPKERIAEDKLRMLRAIRFATKLNFEIDDASFIAIRNNAHMINEVSVERIADELIKILRTKNFTIALNLLVETNLLQHIIPEMVKMIGCEQPVEFHPEGDVFVHTIKVLENLPNDASDDLLLAALLHDIGKPATFTNTDRIRFNNHDIVGAKITKEILTNMHFSNDTINHVSCMVENHMRFRFVREMKKSKLVKFMRMHKFDEHLALHRADCLGSSGKLENFHFASQKFAENEIQNNISAKRVITGNDLIERGMKPGPQFKEILDQAEEMQLEGMDRDTIIKILFEN